MSTSRKTAIIVGVLYIIGTVAGVLGVAITGPVLNDSDYLVKVSANESQIVVGALFSLTMGLALAMVPVMMFSINKGWIRKSSSSWTATLAGPSLNLMNVGLNRVEPVQAGTMDVK